MNREEYLAEVVSFIKNKKAKIEIQKELNTHIDDRIEYYTNAGYDLEYATNKAISQMGSAEDVAKELGKVHNVKIYWGLVIFLIIANTIALLHFYPFMLTFEHNLGGYQILREINVFLAFTITTYIAVNKKISSLPIINLISVSIWSLLPTFIGFLSMKSHSDLSILTFENSLFETASPLAYFLHCVLTLKIENYALIVGTYSYTKSSLLLNIESLILYAILFAISIFISISIKNGKFTKTCKILQTVPLVYWFLSLMIAFVGMAASVYNDSYAYDWIYIQGSNDKENIIAESCIETDYDWNPYPLIWDDSSAKNDFDLLYKDSQVSLIKIDECISIVALDHIYEAKMPTKYYRIVYAENDYPDSEAQYETEWFDLKETTLENSFHKKDSFPVNTFTINFTNKSLIDSDDHYKVYAKRNGNVYSDYEYAVFSFQNWEIERKSDIEKEPIFTYVNDHLLKRSISYGTDNTNEVIYYDLDKNLISQTYNNVYAENDNIAVYVHYDQNDPNSKMYVGAIKIFSGEVVLDELIDTGGTAVFSGLDIEIEGNNIVVTHPKGKDYKTVKSVYQIPE